MDNRNAYRAMESMSPNEDVINTRLESLELESDRYKTWRAVFIALTLFVIVSIGLTVTVSLAHGNRESSTCRDTVKMAAKEASATVLTCDHPRHHGKLDDKYKDVVLSCVCR